LFGLVVIIFDSISEQCLCLNPLALLLVSVRRLMSLITVCLGPGTVHLSLLRAYMCIAGKRLNGSLSIHNHEHAGVGLMAGMPAGYDWKRVCVHA
jgi:hypothetical protein